MNRIKAIILLEIAFAYTNTFNKFFDNICSKEELILLSIIENLKAKLVESKIRKISIVIHKLIKHIKTFNYDVENKSQCSLLIIDCIFASISNLEQLEKDKKHIQSLKQIIDKFTSFLDGNIDNERAFIVADLWQEKLNECLL
jgi:aspartate/glutamate racemase